MGKPQFGYWNLRGLGQSIKFALAYMGVDYEGNVMILISDFLSYLSLVSYYKYFMSSPKKMWSTRTRKGMTLGLNKSPTWDSSALM